MDWTAAILLGLGGYLLGSVPTAYILVYVIKGVDIRQVGTGNVGALNTYHQLGAWGGLVVLLVDAGKGGIAFLVPDLVGAPGWTIFLTGPMVVAGHNWPVFLRFKGGKGAAAIFGISLAAVPLLTLITLGPTVLVIVLMRNVVLGAAFGFILLNTLLVVTEQSAGQVGLCAFLTMVVTATYALSVREHITSSIKSRQWRRLFTGLA